MLFLAQLPPPHHGQTAMAAEMHELFAGDAGIAVQHMWRGGARDAKDIGHRSVRKYFEFAHLVAELVGIWISGQRFDFAYLGLAPWAHTASRDVLLSWLALRVARRVLVHVHGDGLATLIQGQGYVGWLARRGLQGAEVLAVASKTVNEAEAAGIFAKVTLLPNTVPDPGSPSLSRSSHIAVGCMCNLDDRKGVFEFVDVIGVLRQRGVDVQGTIAGGSTARLSIESLREHISALGLSDYVALTGHISGGEKNAFFVKQDVILYLSRHDLAPLALLEALAYGNVPIVIDIGGLREILGPGLEQNALPSDSTRDDVVSMAAEIVATYASSPEQLSSDKAEARARYLSNYRPGLFRERVLHLVADHPDSRDEQLSEVGLSEVTK